MKIGIVCFWNAQDNYGQVLQLLALILYLKKMGHQPFLIRYTPIKAITPRRLKKCLNLVQLYRFIRGKFRNVLHQKSCQSILRHFDEFRRTYIPMTPIIYHNLQELRDNPPVADLYIAGSDQAWGWATEDDHGRVWFLDFLPDQCRRIAYAVSFGQSKLSPHYLKFITPMLKKFERIAVREKSAVAICNQAGCQASHVLDPTMLLSAKDYIDTFHLESKSSSSGLVCYFLNFNKLEDVSWSTIKEYAQNNDRKISLVTAEKCTRLFEKEKISFFPIPEWLDAYYNATEIITTSFHGTVFAILMEKNFLVFPLKKKGAILNDRLYSFLEELGLEDRIFDATHSIAEQLRAPIDWLNTKKKLNELREKSYHYLNEVGI